MFKLLKEVFRTGEATARYPFAPFPVAPDFRGKPEHDAERCIACAACAVACPPNAIQMQTDLEAGTRSWEICYGRCIFCGRCEEVCPTGAIRLSAAFELAVTSKADLTRRAVFQLAPCACCGEPFAPARELAYVAALLGAQSQLGALLTRTCPACRRQHDVEQLARIAAHRKEHA